MDAALSVVILEDRRQDALLMVGALEEHGYKVRWTRVDTREALAEALQHAPDVILADYQLPGFDALEALGISKELSPRTPFIVVTGALGDEAAAACIRAGATDYILKDRLARLGSAVEAAIEQRGLRDLQAATLDALAASERRFRSVFLYSPVGMVVLSSDLQIHDANPAFCATVRLALDEILRRGFADLVAREDRLRVEHLAEALTEGRQSTESIQIRLSTGSRGRVWVQTSLSSLAVDDDTPTHMLAIVEDINERVLAEETARRRDAILQAVGRGAELFLGDGAWDDVVHAYLGLIGRSASVVFAGVVKGCSDGDAVLVHRWDDDRGVGGAGQTGISDPSHARMPAARPVSSEVIEEAARRSREWRLADGTETLLPCQELPAPLTLIRIGVRQQIWGCLVVLQCPGGRMLAPSEIEALRTAADLLGDAIQDREAAEELRISEERTRLIVDTALDAVISLDGSGTITGWNAQAYRTFGWTASEAIGRSFLDLVVPVEARDEWLAHGVGPHQAEDHEQTADVRQSSRFETVGLRRDGRVFPAEVAASRTLLDASTMLGLFVRDLTAQKDAEYELGEARRQDETVAARIQQAMLVGDPPIETPRLSIASETFPGEVVAGDFVATLRHDEDTIDVVIGDVMGKGANAALLGAITKGYVYQAARTLTLRLSEFRRLPEPHEVVAALHSHMTKELQQLDSFVTLMYARFDLMAMRCTLVDCGHTRSVHWRFSDGSFELVQGDNLPLGVADREFFAPLRVPFSPGDLFFFYSDGVIEAESSSEERFGEERLIQAIASSPSRSPVPLIAHIQKAVRDFQGDQPPSDDMTCLVVSIGHASPERPAFQRTLEIPGTLDALEPVREFVEAFCADMPGPKLHPEAVDALKLAAHEATCNIIGHAHLGRPDMPVQILAEAYEDRIELRLFDIGTGFALEDVETPLSDGTQPSGYGIFLMRQLVDDVDYRRDELGRNYVCLVKRRRSV